MRATAEASWYGTTATASTASTSHQSVRSGAVTTATSAGAGLAAGLFSGLPSAADIVLGGKDRPWLLLLLGRNVKHEMLRVSRTLHLLRQRRRGDVVVLRRDDVDQDAAGVGAGVLDALAFQVRLVVGLGRRFLSL